MAKNFVREVFKCTNQESRDEYRRDLKFVRSENYEFYTYYNALNKKSKIKIPQFINSYVIIDEIHTLRNKKVKGKNDTTQEYSYLKALN